MHVSELLHRQLKKSCPNVNKSTLNRLMLTSDSLLSGGMLCLTSLGREMRSDAHVKHKIKSVDRLLGNDLLYHQRVSIYSGLASQIIGPSTSIKILVDWSPCTNRKQQMLRASLYHKTRSTVLYEEVHPEKTNTKRSEIHRRFLKKLAQIIPDDTDVTVITDAGFHADWFANVRDPGWEFEGRVRGESYYSFDGETWEKTKHLYKKATNVPQFIGSVLLTKKNKFPCQLYVYKEAPSQKSKKRKPKISSMMSKKYHGAEVKRTKKKAQDPWVIISSKEHAFNRPDRIIKDYKGRMKIEHDFRNTKNVRWGMGLDAARSANTKRLEMLLLIAALAMFMLWLVGFVTESKKQHYKYQANTVKNTRVLSLVFLGMQVLLHRPGDIRKQELEEALNVLKMECGK